MKQDAPDPAELQRLLSARHPTPGTLTVEVDEEKRAIALSLADGPDVYRIRVAYLRRAGERDAWMLTADALDNLYGMFLEADRDYRSLPTGTDVEFSGAFFSVDVTRERPDLEAAADRLLGDDP